MTLFLISKCVNDEGLEQLSLTEGTSKHAGVCCDICSTQDFKGVRYKCSTCPDFDVCHRCIERVESHDLHSHTFLRIAKPCPMAYAHMTGAVPLLCNRSHWVHKDVSCADCDSSNPDKRSHQIVGYRFFCTICGVSLCEHCEQTSGHDPSHALLKMIPPPSPLLKK
jgi:next to BRCA1 gene 1 protein